MLMIERKEKIYKAGWYLFVFAFLFLWFTRINPLVLYDGDDWLYISYVRKAIPIWKDWNPARVLPEVLMPFCGAAAAYVLTPLTGDYIGSITIVSALAVSGFITAYVICFGKLMERVFSLNTVTSVLFSGLFLLLHFLVFRAEDTYNNYLFHCFDLTCYYYYLIPALLNCSLVMYMMANPQFEALLENGSLEKKAFFAMAVYFAVFSNLPASVILAIFAGGRVLVEFIKGRKNRDGWKTFLKNNAVYFFILIAWLVSAVFELCGGRAGDDQGYRMSLLQGLKETAYRFLLMLKGNNNTFLLFSALVIAGAAVLLFLSKGKGEQDRKFLALATENLICAVVMLAAVIILCAMVDITYITRGEYLFGLYFFGFLILLMSFAYLLQKQPKLLVAVPIVLCVLVSEINTQGKTFLDSNLLNDDANICAAIDRDLVDQIVTASQAGQEEMILHVPISGRSGNWPHASYVGQRIADTLYEHSIIDRNVRVIVEPDPEMNQKHNLSIPDSAQ